VVLDPPPPPPPLDPVLVVGRVPEAPVPVFFADLITGI